jgi:energy-coupling factor transporter ATP-binding protein EcfA2
MITLNNVNFHYDQQETLLQNINLNIAAGEFVVLTGKSGSGKTTLSRVLNGLIPHFYEGNLTGEVYMQKRSLLETPVWQLSQRVGSVFQDPRTQFFTSIVQDELVFELENYGADPPVMRERLAEVCEQMELEQIQKAFLATLSSGQKQKVAIATAAMIDPEVYVLDEPSANLDIAATEVLREALHQLKAQGKTVVIAEHRLYYLMELADRIIYMRDGRIEKEFKPEEVGKLSFKQLKQYGLRSPSLVSMHRNENNAQDVVREKAVEINRLCVRYQGEKRLILEDLNLTLHAGEVCALIGENGAGKTTLARTIAGLIRERSGSIHLFGQRAGSKDRRKQVWFVLQDTVYQLFGDSVLNEMMLSMAPTPENVQRAEELLKKLDLWTFRDAHPATLSGGQKQRLVLGIGLMQEAHVFILDEPTSGLDGENLARVIDMIRELQQRQCHVLVITHDHELVAGVCERVIKLESGTITVDQPVDSLSSPALVQLMSNDRLLAEELNVSDTEPISSVHYPCG